MGRAGPTLSFCCSCSSPYLPVKRCRRPNTLRSWFHLLDSRAGLFLTALVGQNGIPLLLPAIPVVYSLAIHAKQDTALVFINLDQGQPNAAPASRASSPKWLAGRAPARRHGGHRHPRNSPLYQRRTQPRPVPPAACRWRERLLRQPHPGLAPAAGQRRPCAGGAGRRCAPDAAVCRRGERDCRPARAVGHGQAAGPRPGKGASQRPWCLAPHWWITAACPA